MDITHIYVCGTSFTAAGGFEEGNPKRDIIQKYINEEIPSKMEDCAWPAMLKPYLQNDKIKIINRAVPGAGIEHLIHTTMDWIMNNPNLVNNTLFILELSGYGRNFFWCNKLKKYVHVNWDYGVQRKDFYTSVHSGEYWKDSQATIDTLKSLEPLMQRWFNEFKDVEDELYRLQRMFFNFMTYLNYKNIEYKVFGERFIDIEYLNDPLTLNSYLKLSHRGKMHGSLHQFLIAAGLQIKQLTKGESDDFHATLEGNREIARQYYEQLSKQYNL